MANYQSRLYDAAAQPGAANDGGCGCGGACGAQSAYYGRGTPACPSCRPDPRFAPGRDRDGCLSWRASIPWSIGIGNTSTAPIVFEPPRSVLITRAVSLVSVAPALPNNAVGLSVTDSAGIDLWRSVDAQAAGPAAQTAPLFVSHVPRGQSITLTASMLAAEVAAVSGTLILEGRSDALCGAAAACLLPNGCRTYAEGFLLPCGNGSVPTVTSLAPRAPVEQHDLLVSLWGANATGVTLATAQQGASLTQAVPVAGLLAQSWLRRPYLLREVSQSMPLDLVWGGSASAAHTIGLTISGRRLPGTQGACR